MKDTLVLIGALCTLVVLVLYKAVTTNAHYAIMECTLAMTGVKEG